MSNYSKVKQGKVYKIAKHPIVSQLSWVHPSEFSTSRSRRFASAAPSLQTDSAAPNKERSKPTSPETPLTNPNTPTTEMLHKQPALSQPKEVASIQKVTNLAHAKPASSSSLSGSVPTNKHVLSLFRKKSDETNKELQPTEDLLKRLALIRSNKRASDIQQSDSPASSINHAINDSEAAKRIKVSEPEVAQNGSIESHATLPAPILSQFPCPNSTDPGTAGYEDHPKSLGSASAYFFDISRKGSIDSRPESHSLPDSTEGRQSVINSYAPVQTPNHHYMPLTDPPVEHIPKDSGISEDSIMYTQNVAGFSTPRLPQSIAHRARYASTSESHYPSQASDPMTKSVSNNFPISSPSVGMSCTPCPATCVNHPGQSLDNMSTDNYSAVAHLGYKAGLYSESNELQEVMIHDGLVQHGEPSSRLFVSHDGQLMWRQSQEPFNRAGVIKQFLLYIGFTSQTAEMMINSEGQDKMDLFQDQFSKFSEWCCERDYDPWTFNEVIGLNYITEVSRDQDFFTLEAIRDALSSTWALVHGDRNLFKDSPRVLLFFKGLRMNLTRKPRVQTLLALNPHLPFSLFKKWGANAELSHTQLCQKTAFLITSVTSWSSLDLSRILRSQVQCTANNTIILNSVDAESRKVKQVELQEFNKSPSTCPVKAIKDYMQWFRPADPDIPNHCLFGPTPNPNNRVNATPKMIDSWIQAMFLTAERELAHAPC